MSGPVRARVQPGVDAMPPTTTDGGDDAGRRRTTRSASASATSGSGRRRRRRRAPRTRAGEEEEEEEDTEDASSGGGSLSRDSSSGATTIGTSASASASASSATNASEEDGGDVSDVSDENGGTRRSGRRRGGFVTRVVGALTPKNWGFRISAATEEEEEEEEDTEEDTEEEADETEEDTEEEDETEEQSTSAGYETTSTTENEVESVRDGTVSESESDSSRRGSGGEASTPRDDAASWIRERAPKEPVPWISRDSVYTGPFRDNVKSFLNRYAVCDGKYTEVGIMGYTVVLSKGTRYETKLRIYEETVAESERAHCDNCRCIGWIHHPVNKRQYHFIVHTDFKAKKKPELAGKRICQLCCCAVSSSERKCSVCDEVDRDCSILDHQTHLLHGEIHANGFGHLKRINGREAGSMNLSGTQLMGLWETICYQLRAREVSVEDVSQKYGVELRLLNPVSHGSTWYGTYGYIFGKGSFGNTLLSHKRAAETLRKFSVKHLRNDFLYVKDLLDKEDDSKAVDIVALLDKYTKLLEKEGVSISTLGDLVSNVLKLQGNIRRAVKEGRRAPEHLVLHGVAAVLAGTKVVEKRGDYARSHADSPKLAKRPPANELQKHAAKKMKLMNQPTRELETETNGKKQPVKNGVIPLEPMVEWSSHGRDAKNAPNTSRWSEARLNAGANACILAMCDQRGKWLSRQEVRNAARLKGIGDTGLLDHVLKTLNDRKVTLPNGTRCVILRRQNVNIMEFMLEFNVKADPAPVAIKKEKVEQAIRPPKLVPIKREPGAKARNVDELTAAEVDRDLLALYHDVLENYKPARLQASVGQRVTVKGAPLVDAARTLLDTKQFLKVYTPLDELLDHTPASKLEKPAANAQKAIRIIVTAVMDTRHQAPALSGLVSNAGKARPRSGTITRPPPELAFLPSDPTLGDLKRVASKAFRDLYIVLNEFRVTRVKGYEGMSDKTRLGWRKMHGASVEVHGEGADLESEFRYQGGFEQWTVSCMCGTGDDDGERMIACDKCGVWMHTRCVGIRDSANAPKHWICPNCSPNSAVPTQEPRARPPPRRRNE